MNTKEKKEKITETLEDIEEVIWTIPTDKGLELAHHLAIATEVFFDREAMKKRNNKGK